MIVILIFFAGFIGSVAVMYLASSSTEIEVPQEEATETSETQ